MTVEASIRPTPTTAIHHGLLGAVGVALAAGVGLHVVGGVDPLRQVLSDAASTAAGAVLLGVACASLIVAGGLLAVAARDVPHRGALHVLLALWTVGLAMVALFPTGTDGLLHTCGAALVIVIPPVVGVLAARSSRLWTATIASGSATAVFGVAHLPTLLAGAGGVPFVGLLERVVLALMLVVIVLAGTDLRERR